MPQPDSLPLADLQAIDQACLRFEQAWQTAVPPQLEDYITEAAERVRPALVRQLLALELDYRRRRGETPRREEYLTRLPGLASEVNQAFGGADPSTEPLLLARALELGLLTASQGASLLQAWRLHPTLPVPDLLRQHGLSQDQIQRLLRSTLPAEGARPGELTVDSDQGRPVGSIGQLVTYVPEAIPAPHQGDHTVQVSSRYAVREQVGQGGLGKVHRARDLHLNREVAIKEILGASPGSDREERFLVEAQVTGQLEHPGVVPVYDLGRKADGSLYYAMKLYRGRTLLAAIQALHRLPDNDPERPVQFTQLLGAFVGVCNAVAFAHNRGVLHRDLKPSNVMLGDFGEAQVIDWGLARLLRSQPAPAGADPHVWVEAGSRLREEERGVVVGTLGYMAPEQADAADDLDARADVWSLGAVLYELLTGRAPLRVPANLPRPEARRWLLDQIRGGKIARPRSISAQVPRPLEAVCLKALAPTRADRYNDARELALEIERWLAGEAVQAYPEPLWDRSRRRVKRHRTLATTAAAVLLVALVGGGLWRWQEGRRVDEARAVVDASRREARAHADRGEPVRAREEVLRGLAVAERESSLAGLVPELKEVLAQAEATLRADQLRQSERERLANFRHLRDEALLSGALLDTPNTVQRGRDTDSLARQTLTLAGYEPERGPRFVAGLFTPAEEAEVREGCRLLLLARAEALALQPDRLDEALRLLEQARIPQPEYVYHQRRARYLRQMGRPQEANEAQKIADTLATRTPLDHRLAAEEWMAQGQFARARRELRAALALDPGRFETLYLLAACTLRLKRWAEAEALLTGCAVLRPDFVGTYVLRGLAYGELDELALALKDFDRARALSPNEGGVYLNRGFVRMRYRQHQAAVEDFQQAARLWARDPSPLLNQAEAYRQQGKFAEAAKALDDAITLTEGKWGRPHLQQARLWLERTDKPEVDPTQEADKALQNARNVSPEGSLLRAQIETEQGRLHHRQKQFPQARLSYEQALKHSPDTTEARRLLAETLMELGDPAQALTHLEDYLERSGLLQDGWTTRQRELGLVFREMALAEMQQKHLSRGVPLAALADYLLQRDPAPVTYDRRRTAMMHARVGWGTLVDAERAAVALGHFDQAIRMSNDVPDNGDAYAGRAYALAVQGKHAEAVENAEQAVRRGPAGVVLLNAACACARATREALADTALNENEARTQAAKNADRAVELLEQAVRRVKEGDRAAWVEQYVLRDAAFDPLRQHRGFNMLIAKYLR